MKKAVKKAMKKETRHLKRAVELVGGQTALAAAISERSRKKIKQEKVWKWLNRDLKMPPEYAPYIEAITDGAVNRRQLCPNFPWDM